MVSGELAVLGISRLNLPKDEVTVTFKVTVT